jgi:RNA polymerase sigma-70 factor (ECF subfamily)
MLEVGDAMRPQPAQNDAPAPAACAAFLRELDYLYRALRRHGASSDDVEDLAQDVFLVMWRRWGDYDGARPLRPWLTGIVFKVVSRHRQRRRRELPIGPLEPADEALRPDERLSLARERALALTALARLKERHRAALVLSDLDGVPMREIAQLLSVPIATAYTRVARARRAFAKEVASMRGELARSGRRSSDAEALLAAERTIEPLPEATRKRIEARLASARPRSPEANDRGRTWPSPRTLAADLVIAGALLFFTFAGALSRSADRAGLLGNEIPETGLVGFWRFDEAGGTIAHDLSGHGRHCVLRHADPRAAWTTGAVGGAVDLAGSGWFECPSLAPATAAGATTVALWVKVGRPLPGHHAFVTQEVGAGRRDEYFFGLWNGELRLSSQIWELSLERSFGAAPGRWRHVAFTRAVDGTATLYLDGREAGRARGTLAPPLDEPRQLSIGTGHTSYQATPRQHLEGGVDHLMIYDRALSAEEIAALAGTGRSRGPEL